MSVYFYMRINSDDDWDEKKYFRQEKKLRSFAEKNEFAFNTEGQRMFLRIIVREPVSTEKGGRN